MGFYLNKYFLTKSLQVKVMEEPDQLMTNIQHQEPSVYYCYKFWFSSGEVQEGCTEILTSNNMLGLDLNEYGWLYMTIPIVGLFLLILIFYALCGRSKSPPPTQHAIYRSSFRGIPKGETSTIPLEIIGGYEDGHRSGEFPNTILLQISNQANQ